MLSDIDPLLTCILLVGGFVAGIINTFAGNGSVITLGMLTELVGLPANLANGTNRIGVLIQGAASFGGLVRSKGFELGKNLPYIILVCTGALVGGLVATVISNENFTLVYQVMMIVMFITMFAKPSRWIQPPTQPATLPSPWISFPILFLVGFYGGFIQMGMGLIFLGVTVLLMKFDLMQANILKVLIVLLFSILVLAIFIYNDMVQWIPGLSIGIGQGTGGWIAGRYISKSEKANKIAYYILIIAMMLVLVKMFLL